MSWVDILKAPIGGVDVPEPQNYYEFALDDLKEILDDWDKDDPVDIVYGPIVAETDKLDLVEGSEGQMTQAARGAKQFVSTWLRFVTDRPIKDLKGLREALRQKTESNPKGEQRWNLTSTKGERLKYRYPKVIEKYPNAREYYIRPTKDFAKKVREEIMPSGKTRQSEMRDRGIPAKFTSEKTQKRKEEMEKEIEELGIKNTVTFINAVKDYPVWEANDALRLRDKEWFNEAWNNLRKNILDETTTNKLKSMLEENNLENESISHYRRDISKFIREPLIDALSELPVLKYNLFKDSTLKEAVEDLTENKEYMQKMYFDYIEGTKPFRTVFNYAIARPAIKQYWNNNFKTIVTDLRNKILEKAKETIKDVIEKKEARIEREKKEARALRDKREAELNREREEANKLRERNRQILREKEEHRQRSRAGQGAKWGKPQIEEYTRNLRKPKEIKMPENIPLAEDAQRKPRRKKRPKSQLTDAEFTQRQYDKLKRDLKNAKRNQPKKVIQELERKITNLERNNPNLKKSFIDLVLNKAIIETEFVRDYPQYVTEMKEEMKFRNIDQPEAEMKIAKKYRLPILSKLQGRSGGGRWTRMLKLAGAVMAGHAGIESKPIYGKKKKKKEEDEE